MKIKTWTVDEMLAERPCADYTRARIEELWAGRERLSLLDILDFDIPDLDKIWACCRNHPHRGAWLDVVVTRAVRTHAVGCGVPAVESWAQIWLGGDRTAEAAEAAARASEAAEAAWAEAAGAAAARASAKAERRQQIADMRKLLVGAQEEKCQTV